MKTLILTLLINLIFTVSLVMAQKDTVVILGFKETGEYGTLNLAINEVSELDKINSTVFLLKSYERYILTESIVVKEGDTLEIIASKAGTTQETAPPQILWTENNDERSYIIRAYGDVIMSNVWIRYADILGNKISSSIVFEDQDEINEPETGLFDGCIFDYAGLGAEAGGAITVKADHFEGEFYNCYWRNNADVHFRYYGRAVSFPYDSKGWHYDKLLFENCSFSNLSRVVMMEGNEYGSNIHLNHCTVINSVEWIIQSGWLQNISITNSIIYNPYMYGYREVNLCDDSQNYEDFQNGLCDPPKGGLIQDLIPVDSFGFDVDFTDQDRQLYVSNNVYKYADYLLDWYVNCPWARDRILNNDSERIHNPSPMIGQLVNDFQDSLDINGNRAFPNINVDSSSTYFVDPNFIVPATNQDSMLQRIEYWWCCGSDISWDYMPNSGLYQTWPLPENLAYNNLELQTAGMGEFPLGDLNWYPEKLSEWQLQKDEEWAQINHWMNYGEPLVGVEKTEENLITEYMLEQNYPNPFNPTTTINYQIPRAGFVSIKVFNLLGQEVASLVNEEKAAGKYKINFDASNLSSGIYIYKLETNSGFIQSRKMVLIK